MKNNTWTLFDYFDVWGNAEDGWEVNNQSMEFDDLYIADDVTDEELIAYLKSINYLSKHVQLGKDVVIEDNGDMIEIFKADDLMPICRLQRNW